MQDSIDRREIGSRVGGRADDPSVESLFLPMETLHVFPSGQQEVLVKDIVMAVVMTVIFSVGVGVLFVKTVYELLELFFNPIPNDSNHPVHRSREV